MKSQRLGSIESSDGELLFSIEGPRYKNYPASRTITYKRESARSTVRSGSRSVEEVLPPSPAGRKDSKREAAKNRKLPLSCPRGNSQDGAHSKLPLYYFISFKPLPQKGFSSFYNSNFFLAEQISN